LTCVRAAPGLDARLAGVPPRDAVTARSSHSRSDPRRPKPDPLSATSSLRTLPSTIAGIAPEDHIRETVLKTNASAQFGELLSPLYSQLPFKRSVVAATQHEIEISQEESPPPNTASAIHPMSRESPHNDDENNRRTYLRGKRMSDSKAQLSVSAVRPARASGSD
jgi:hypothetical protein